VLCCAVSCLQERYRSAMEAAGLNITDLDTTAAAGATGQLARRNSTGLARRNSTGLGRRASTDMEGAAAAVAAVAAAAEGECVVGGAAELKVR